MGALVTIGALTKNSELVVMKACGISLYRAASPLLILAMIGSALLIGLEERLLAYSNRRADAINNAIRGRLPMTQSLDRRWVAANNGNIYQYLYFEPGRNRLNGLSIYEFGKDASSLARRQYFDFAQFNGDREARGQVQWQGGTGWRREFQPKKFVAFTNHPVVMEGPGYFASDRPDAEHMSYRQLSDHVTALQAGGFNVVPYVVSLHRKLAFPFVTLIMALIAVPFAVTSGKHGAMYGSGRGHRAGHCLLDHDQRLRCDRRRRPHGARARGLGAEYHLRLRGDVPAADGTNVKHEDEPLKSTKMHFFVLFVARFCRSTAPRVDSRC